MPRHAPQEPCPASRVGTLPAANPGDGLDLSLQRAGRGQKDDFDRVYRAMSSSVYGLAVRLLRDPAPAAQVTQDVFVDVWQCAARFDPRRGSARAWVMAIAHRKVVDEVVDRIRVQHIGVQQQMATVPASAARFASGGIGPDSEAMQAPTEWQRLRGYTSLTEAQRESLVLAYCGGQTSRQIADLLGTSPADVDTDIRAALVQMRECSK